MRKYWVIQRKSFSYLIDKKTMFAIIILTMIALLSILISIGVGELYIPPLEVFTALIGSGLEMNQMIITEFRLPRVLVAFIAGASLALAGAILQGVIRNPLASPDMVGITGGAGFAAVAFLTLFSDDSNNLLLSMNYMPLFAFVGATIVAFLIYALAWKDGVTPIRLILIGIGLMALFQALTTLMMLMGPIYRASQATVWLTGTVYGTSWKEVKAMLPWFLGMLPILILLVRRLNIQGFGDDLTTVAGISVHRERFMLLMVCTALAGSAVAFAGAMGFVGLIGPHIARRITGSSFGGLFPAAALIGGIMVVLADLAGRTLFSPLEVPAGVFTAAIGAPYFIYLLFKNQ
ncbi:FecCD family ABC transporter permease [Fictibacillus phosphorivorans]|uniref:FecCD family ABC transporter permease n=1 Tax=Fictibacillus phosphorivorans TaxID=1221500 RepID=UPI00203B9AA6|nr:iron ABC transporter permease [Fictibacillus phosphorivorans]MCM3718603.1 iron ABC transporter permease [Fictibacillus phosphorivorans]MCM3776226.1 iron ABC transporter permease [Fictibacillus phosphorivorans]